MRRLAGKWLLVSISVSLVLWKSTAGAAPFSGGGHETEFHDWLLANGAKGVAPPDQRLSLIDELRQDTRDALARDYQTYELEAEGGRGVFASSDAKPGDVLLSIPTKVMLGLDEDGGPLPYPRASDEAALAALLLREMAKGEESSFGPYLKMLPKHVPVPWLTLSPEEYKELHFQEAIETVEAMHKEVEEWKEKMDPAMTGNATAAEIEWASAIVSSRIFWLPIKKGKGRMNITRMLEEGQEYPQTRPVLLPFGDMLNYHPLVDQVTWDQRIYANRIELVATEEIQQGMEVYEPHAGRSAVELFVESGILSDAEMFDTIQIFSTLKEAVKWYDKAFRVCPDKTPKDMKLCRRELLNRARDIMETMISLDDDLTETVGSIMVEDERYRFAFTAASCLDEGLAKVFAAFWSVTAKRGRRREPLSYSGLEGPMGMARAHGLSAVRLRIEELLESCPTTAKEDAALLKGSSTEDGAGSEKKQRSPGMELAVKFRLGVKRRLETSIEDAIGLLDGIVGFAKKLQQEAESTR